jgi:hypothetical protein
MSFCPQCRYEYKPDVVVCPDCGTQLVDVLPGENEEGGEAHARPRWRLLYNATARSAAEFLEEALKSSGITCVVKYRGGYFGRAVSYGVGAITSTPDAEVYVLEEQFSEAEEIRRQTVGDEDSSLGYIPKD